MAQSAFWKVIDSCDSFPRFKLSYSERPTNYACVSNFFALSAYWVSPSLKLWSRSLYDDGKQNLNK